VLTAEDLRAANWNDQALKGREGMMYAKYIRAGIQLRRLGIITDDAKRAVDLSPAEVVIRGGFRRDLGM